MTPLMIASNVGNYSIVEFLVLHGADINAKDGQVVHFPNVEHLSILHQRIII